MHDRAELPTAAWEGSFNVFGVDVRCATLSDGRRVIEKESYEELREAMKCKTLREKGDMDKLARWQRGEDVEGGGDG